MRESIARHALQWCYRQPASFYAVAFVFAWQMATFFDDLRNLASFPWVGLHRLVALAP